MPRTKVDREAFRRAGEAWRRGNVGRALFNATKRFEQDVLEVLEREGFDTIRMVHLNLYRNLDFDGTRLTDLAARASMTKQSMLELVDKAEQQRFVERRPDPVDRRAKIVAFNNRGLKLLDALHKGIVHAEKEMVARLGVKDVENIATCLAQYVDPARGEPVRRPKVGPKDRAVNNP